MNNNYKYYGTLYVVEEKDNLFNIAKRFHTTVDKLIKINGLKNTTLYPGQFLIVDDAYNPKNVYLYEKHVVQPGETLPAIAFKYHMTADQLMEINNILSNEIKAGDILYVFPTEIVLEKDIYYMVKPDDSLYSIAKKYNITIDELKSLNNLNNENLNVGQILLVLTEEMINNMKKYVDMYYVQPGDNLYSIAESAGTTVEKLKAVNYLTNDLLKVGQLILIPYQNKKTKSIYD
ncbi:MAG: LysM peptidoglycan-binding domain-containing protein [Bacilli bacterium]|nr:LysM peptidoglycan-binding domain-containing protein [Bacilli bacterium]